MFPRTDARNFARTASNEGFNQLQNVSQQDSNVTVITEFLLVGGLQTLQGFCTELSVLLLVVYITVLLGNSLIFTLVVFDYKLHTPMYIFLINLSIIDIVVTTCVLPKMISVCLHNDISISFSACFLQIYIYLTFQTAETFMLSIMAYDRYVAICNPLRYTNIVTKGVVALLATAAWAFGMIIPAIVIIPTSQLPFCSNEVMFWFCDFPPVVTLACVDTTYLIDLALALAIIVLYLTLSLIVWSYAKIIIAVCRIASAEGRKKAISTCSSHLIIVITFYFIHSCVYISAKAENVPPKLLIFISIINCFLVPLMNPIVYSFRNKEIKTSLLKLLYLNKVDP